MRQARREALGPGLRRTPDDHQHQQRRDENERHELAEERHQSDRVERADICALELFSDDRELPGWRRARTTPSAAIRRGGRRPWCPEIRSRRKPQPWDRRRRDCGVTGLVMRDLLLGLAECCAVRIKTDEIGLRSHLLLIKRRNENARVAASFAIYRRFLLRSRKLGRFDEPLSVAASANRRP